MNVILQKSHKKYSNFNFKQKCGNMITIISLKCCANKLFSIRVKWLLIKGKKDYFDFEPIFNTKSTILLYLIIKYCQEKNQILILIWMICKKKISSYEVTTLKLFLWLFHVYQRLALALIDLAEVNHHHVFLFFALITMFLLDPKYYLNLIRYYTRPCMLLSIYKHIHTINNW